MHVSTLFTSLALAAVILAAPTTTGTRGTLFVSNHCSEPVYLWDTSSKLSAVYTVKPDGVWTGPLYFDGKTGTAIKIGTTDTAIWTAGEILNFGYTLNDAEGSVYYDLSTVYGFAPLFQGKKITLQGTPGKNVPEIVWDGAVPAGQQTKAYFGDTDFHLDLCA